MATLFLLLAILLSTFNEGYGFIRYHDIFVLLSFMLCFEVKRINSVLYYFFAILILVMVVNELYWSRISNYNIYGFYYKYLFLCVLIGTGSNVFNEYSVRSSFYYCFYVVFLFMIVWACVYGYLLDVGYIVGSKRVGFYSYSEYIGDPHLYSYVLGYLLIFYLLVLKKILLHGKFMTLLLSLLSLYALMLTGSKTPWFGFFFIGLYYFFYKVVEAIKNRRFRIKPLSIVVFFAFVLTVFTYSPYLHELVDGIDSFARVSGFDYQSDQSFAARVYKLNQAIDMFFEGPILISVNLDNINTLWYDNIIANLLVYMGLIGVLIYFFSAVFVYYLFYKLRRKAGVKYFASFLALYFYVLISLVLTEYVLVSRAAILTILPFVLYYKSSLDYTLK